MQKCEQLLAKGFQARQEELYDLALNYFEQASKLDPDDAAIHIELVRSQIDAGMFVEARNKLNQLTNAGIDDPSFLLELGELWMGLGDVDQSLTIYSQIKPSQQEFIQACLSAVVMLERTHRSEELRFYVKQVEAINPDGLHCLFTRAILASSIRDDEEAESCLKKIWDQGSRTGLYVEAGYRLARLYARKSQITRALTLLTECKAIESKQFTSSKLGDAVKERRFYDIELLKNITPNWFDDRVDVQDTDHVMILGHPRSGTSLVAKRLAESTGACWVDESPLYEVLGQRWISGHPEASNPLKMLDLLSNLQPQETQNFFAQYSHQLIAQAGVGTSQSRRMIDKNPGLTASLVALHKLLPQTAWLLILRDPRDIAMSCYFQKFGATQLGWACQTPQGAMSAVMHVMKIWTTIAEHLTHKNHLTIRYEDFVANEKSEITTIADNLGWNQQQRPSGNQAGPRVNMTPSYGDIQLSTYQSSCGRWKTAGDTFALHNDTDYTLLSKLGYEV